MEKYFVAKIKADFNKGDCWKCPLKVSCRGSVTSVMTHPSSKYECPLEEIDEEHEKFLRQLP